MLLLEQDFSPLSQKTTINIPTWTVTQNQNVIDIQQTLLMIFANSLFGLSHPAVVWLFGRFYGVINRYEQGLNLHGENHIGFQVQRLNLSTITAYVFAVLSSVVVIQSTSISRLHWFTAKMLCNYIIRKLSVMWCVELC